MRLRHAPFKPERGKRFLNRVHCQEACTRSYKGHLLCAHKLNLCLSEPFRSALRAAEREKHMRRTMLAAVISFGAAVGVAQAQVPGTNLGTPQTQPQPGGGVAAGPGAPTSATQAAPGNSMDPSRGAPPAGGGTAAPGGDTSTGSPTLTPGGAITPGTPATRGSNSGG